MDVYCTKCGTKADEGHVKCINCGTDLHKGVSSGKTAPSENPATPKPPAKKPITQKQKVIRGIIIALLAIIIGGSFWGNKYYAAESVMKRFHNALIEQDTNMLEKLAIHEDGTNIKAFEAEAIAKLAKEETQEILEFSKVMQHGKFLGVFKKHQVQLPDQYAYYEGEGLTFLFNGEKAASETDEIGGTSYGPLLPGIYEVEPVLDDYDTSELTVPIYLGYDAYRQEWLNYYFPISNANIAINNYDEDIMKDAKLIVGEKEIPMENGAVEGAGPFLINGEQSVKVSATMPWGEVMSEELPIESSEQYLDLTVLSDETYKQVMNVIKDFGEQESEALANKTTKPFKVITKDFREGFAENLNRYDDNYYKSSKLVKIEFDRDSLDLIQVGDRFGVQLSTQFYLEASVDELGEELSLENEELGRDIFLLFNKENDSWEIDEFDHREFWSFSSTDMLEGSKQLHTPSKELIAAYQAASKEDDVVVTLPESNKDADTDEVDTEEFNVFLNDYHSASVEAINSGNFSIVAGLFTSNAPAGKEAESYIDYLVEKGITEKHLGTAVEKVESAGDDWSVTSIDEYIIYYKDGTESRKKFRSVTTVKQENGQLKMHELLSTKEI